MGEESPLNDIAESAPSLESPGAGEGYRLSVDAVVGGGLDLRQGKVYTATDLGEAYRWLLAFGLIRRDDGPL